MKQKFTKLFLALFTLVMFANLSTAQVNMDRYIELTVQQGAEIWLNFMVDAPNTEVRVVCGTYDTTFVAGANWTNFVDESTQATTIKLYGNVSGFMCIDHGEKVTGLDASNNTGLVVLDCWNNNLTSLDVSGLSVLEHFNCSGNNLSSLNVNGLTALELLRCFSNNLSFLDLSGLVALRVVECHSNNLSSLNVNGLTALELLRCFSNNLSSLDVSGLTALVHLHCHENNLSSLDVSGLGDLQEISCYSNNLSTIKVSGCDYLISIDCSGNNLSACGLDSLFHQLPRRPGEIYIKDGVATNPGALTCRDTIATNRNWKVRDGGTPIGTPIVNSNYECPYFTLGIEELIVNNINARVYPNPVSNYLNIECEESINKLELYDSFGRIVISQESVLNNTSIDVSSLANGIYILKLRTAEGMGEYKVVKN